MRTRRLRAFPTITVRHGSDTALERAILWMAVPLDSRATSASAGQSGAGPGRANTALPMSTTGVVSLQHESQSVRLAHVTFQHPTGPS